VTLRQYIAVRLVGTSGLQQDLCICPGSRRSSFGILSLSTIWTVRRQMSSSREGTESTRDESVIIKPFTLSIPDSELLDLQRRLKGTRWPNHETVDNWSQGVPLATLKDLCDYWINTYDWRRCEAWFSNFPQYKASIDGEEIHFLHIRFKRQDALPLLLLHGWPGSVLELCTRVP
jgi:hypothetical protein